MREFLSGRVVLHEGDCAEILQTLDANSIDSIVTDPPYHLTSIVKRFGKSNLERDDSNLMLPRGGSGKVSPYKRASAGFMGKQWDGGDIAFRPELWAEACRVLKPGGHMVAFSGTRTYHRMVCAIEDAGFEVRDMLSYIFGSGFPKSHNINNKLNGKVCNCERTETISECGLRLVPSSDISAAESFEKEQTQVLFDGLSEQGISTSRRQKFPDYAWEQEPGLEGRGDVSESSRELCERSLCALPSGISDDVSARRLRDGTSPANGETDSPSVGTDRMRPPHRPQSAEQHADEPGTVAGQSQSQECGAWDYCLRCGKPVVPDGLGTALKPAHEPICLARKPLSEPAVAANVLRWGTGAINVGGCRVGSSGGTSKNASDYKSETTSVGGYLNAKAGEPIDAGRWPPNLAHDGSEEVLAGFPDRVGSHDQKPTQGARSVFVAGGGIYDGNGNNDSGSAARFFYTAKADGDDRLGSKHPTVKPLDLIQWLCRLVTPTGGTILDMFAGTGTTGEAAYREGFKAILIEREAEYQVDIARRMGLVLDGPVTRKNASVKARGRIEDAGPLFALKDAAE